MSLKYMQGFETVRDDSDLRAQGWLPCPGYPPASGKATATFPSVTPVAGYSLRPIVGYQNIVYNSIAWGANTDLTFGYLNTGYTINQAWAAGGITLGFGAQFHSGTSAAYGNLNLSSTTFDGTLYWAIRGTSTGSISVATSPNLTNWTVAPSSGLPGLGASASLAYMGGTVVAATLGTGNTAGVTAYYTNNNGQTWASQSLFTTSVSGVPTGSGIATGNSSFPHLYIAGITAGAGNTAQVGGIWVGQFGGTMTNVVSLPNGTSTAPSPLALAAPRIFGSLVVAAFSSNALGQKLYSCAQSGIGTAGNWVTTPLPASLTSINDFVYHAPSNLWILATPSGISTFANPGPSGTPTLTTTAIATLGTPYSGGAIYKVFVNSNNVIAGLGVNGNVVTSTDGVTWTSTPHLLATSASQSWISGLYDGSKYVLFSTVISGYTGNGIIATSPDLVNNFQAAYVMEATEVVTSLGSGLVGGGLIGATAAPSANGQFTPDVNYGGFLYLVVGNASGGVRQFAVYDSVNRSTAYITGSIPTTSLYHYFELRYVSVAGTANMFNVYLYVDGALVGQTLNYQFARTINTTTVFLVGMQRNGAFTAFDDIYVTIEDGQGLSGAQGVVNIVAQRPTTDVQAQWTKNGSAASNSLSVNQPALSSSTTNFISSSNAGDKDLYSTTDTLPAGYTAKAVLVESYFTKTSSTSPTVSVGVKSGSSEKDSANATLNTTGAATYVSVIADSDPNGNVPWTNAAVNASQFVENHIT